ncbi:sensor histidine kinase [Clostridium kluyveri]|uniref:sensor histidine kinase n=1 Tax=Clostridium kluyveri TaxID=1534 RepID=UPI0022457AB4|nr:HAMP domain-containing sensor histidine kinase [Clostridium kluyveri]UZQ49477.1 HAMP domain-containing histidine kinase [Clostridium kluyveri]
MKFMNKIKTNWSLTTKFLVTLVFIIMIEFIVVMFVWRSAIIYTKSNLPGFNPEKFTWTFSKYIDVEDNKPVLNDEGKNELVKNKAWIQIIDESFKEMYSFRKPQEVPKVYTPVKMAHIYKYDIANYSIFISEKEYDNESFAYIIGFPTWRIAKHTVIFNPTALRNFFGGGFIVLLAVNVTIAVIASYFIFGKRMGRPLETIINSINELSRGHYETNHLEQGVYKNVFANLNNLGKTLKENKNKREEMEKVRENWISSISHDVKTPLSSIKGYAEIMKDSDYTFSQDEILDYSKIIYDKSSYIQGLVEDLNFTYKLKNRTIPLKKENVNVVALIQNIIVEILNHPLYSNRNINLYFERENINILTDKNLFRRAISNLIFNAIIHNPQEVRVDVSVYEKDRVHILIKDNGRGISQNDLKYIFERYYRGTNTNVSVEGSGLGMAISKQIIDVQGGSINVESTLGKGTNIDIVL